MPSSENPNHVGSLCHCVPRCKAKPRPKTYSMEKAIEEHRVRVFLLSAQMVELHADLVTALLSGLLITKAEFVYSRNSFVYQAFSPEFGPTEEGSEPPRVGIRQIEKKEIMGERTDHPVNYCLVELKFCDGEHDMVEVI